jgi:hypothetical protein
VLRPRALQRDVTVQCVKNIDARLRRLAGACGRQRHQSDANIGAHALCGCWNQYAGL